MSESHLLIVGAGSVGRRHARNLAALGCRISALDPRADRLEEAAREVRLERAFPDLDSALGAEKYDGVVICSPPKFHVDQSLAALKRRLPVLLEKPVSPDLASARRLASAVHDSGVPLLLGYSYRWWKPLGEFRRRLQARELGRPLHVRCTLSAHLADWHPWERYQDFFMASRDLGGGALLDESHFIDLMLWIFGKPARVFAQVEKLSGLEIETDDNVDAWIAYPDGMRVVIHLDLYGRPHDRSMVATCENGTLQWTFDPNRIRSGTRGGPEWEDTSFAGERNDMFVGTAEEFVAVVAGKTAPSCTIDDGCTVMETIEAMRRSAETGAVQGLG